MFFIGSRQIDPACMLTPDDFPAPPEVVCGQTQFPCKNIHGPQRHQAESHIGTGNAIYDLVDRAIPARRYNLLVSFGYSTPRQMLRFPRARGRTYQRIAANRAQSFRPAAGALAAGAWIQDDTGFRQGTLS